jgi:hypothetical protein
MASMGRNGGKTGPECPEWAEVLSLHTAGVTGSIPVAPTIPTPGKPGVLLFSDYRLAASRRGLLYGTDTLPKWVMVVLM